MAQSIQNAVAELAERLRRLKYDNVSGRQLVRVEQSIAPVDLLRWLSQQQPLQRAYWQNRSGSFAVAGIGRAVAVELKKTSDVQSALDQLSILSGEAAHCLGYLSFSDSDSTVWPSFGYGVFFSPQIELNRCGERCILACNLPAHDENSLRESVQGTLELLESVEWSAETSVFSTRRGAIRCSPDYAEWSAAIDRALDAFKNGALSKVVLSREARVELENGRLDPWQLLDRWQSENRHSYLYCFETDNGECFLGCSPERLFRRSGRTVDTEALAGTARRGDDRDEDARLALRLLNDDKNIHENRLVLTDICSRLEALCERVEYDNSHSVVKLRRVQHLRYRIRGVLTEGVGDSELLGALHPTPAVGGVQREAALRFIEENEPYPRGLYAGACGLLGREQSEFAVSIRSALLKENHLSLFSGAGIVSGSNAADEWQELDNKIDTVLTLLESNGSAMGGSTSGAVYGVSRHQLSRS